MLVIQVSLVICTIQACNVYMAFFNPVLGMNTMLNQLSWLCSLIILSTLILSVFSCTKPFYCSLFIYTFLTAAVMCECTMKAIVVEKVQTKEDVYFYVQLWLLMNSLRSYVLSYEPTFNACDAFKFIIMGQVTGIAIISIFDCTYSAYAIKSSILFAIFGQMMNTSADMIKNGNKGGIKKNDYVWCATKMYTDILVVIGFFISHK